MLVVVILKIFTDFNKVPIQQIYSKYYKLSPCLAGYNTSHFPQMSICSSHFSHFGALTFLKNKQKIQVLIDPTSWRLASPQPRMFFLEAQTGSFPPLIHFCLHAPPQWALPWPQGIRLPAHSPVPLLSCFFLLRNWKYF